MIKCKNDLTSHLKCMQDSDQPVHVQTLESSFFAVLITIFLRLYDGVFSFQNNPKDLDPSYKMDLDLWDRLGRVKLIL